MISNKEQTSTSHDLIPFHGNPPTHLVKNEPSPEAGASGLIKIFKPSVATSTPILQICRRSTEISIIARATAI